MELGHKFREEREVLAKASECPPSTRTELLDISRDEREVFTLGPGQVNLLPHHQWSCETNSNKKE